MTISELIALLSEIKANHGDLDVRAGYTVCTEDEEYNCGAPINYACVNLRINDNHVVLQTSILVDDYDDDDM